MVKAEWGTKHGCPKCATRFYDLHKTDPITCIACGYAWLAESVLKSKQPMPFEETTKPVDSGKSEDADNDLDIDVDDDGGSSDNDVDLGGDDDLGVAATDNKDDEN